MVDFAKFNKFPIVKDGKVFLLTITNEIVGFKIQNHEAAFLKRELIAWYASPPSKLPWKSPLAIEIADQQRSKFDSLLRAHRQTILPHREPYGLHQEKYCSDYNFGAVCSRLGILPVVDPEGQFRDIGFFKKLIKEEKCKNLFEAFADQYEQLFPPLQMGGEQIVI
jgi:hypothetical protein